MLAVICTRRQRFVEPMLVDLRFVFPELQITSSFSYFELTLKY